MTTIGFYEARTHFSELLDQVARGKTVLITRHGKPAAVLSPPARKSTKDIQRVIEEFKTYSARQRRTTGKLGFREMIEEGRRF